MEQKYFSTDDASKLLGISARRLRDWIKDGKVKAIKYPASDRWMISREEIARIIGVRVNAIEDAEESIKNTGLNSEETKKAIDNLFEVYDE